MLIFRFLNRVTGLRGKLLFLGLSSLLITSFLVGGYALDRGEEAIMSSVQKRLDADVDQAARRLTDVVNDMVSDLEIWSKLDAAPSSLDNHEPKFFAEFANQAVSNKDVYAYQVLLEIDGTLFGINEQSATGEAIANYPLPHVNVAKTPWFETLKASEKTVLIGPFEPKSLLQVAPEIKTVGNQLILARPVIDMMDDTAGYWVSMMDWRWVENYFDTLISGDAGKSTRFPLLLGPDQQVIAFAPKANISAELLSTISGTLPGQRAAQGEFSIAEDVYLSSVAKLESDTIEIGWTLAVVELKQAALAPVVQFRNRVLLVGASISLCAAIILLLLLDLVVRQVTRPLMKIGRGIELMGEGDLSQDVALPSDPDMQKLTISFNSTLEIMRKVIQGVNATADAVQQSSSSMSHTMDNYASNESRLASMTDNASAASEQMAASLVQMSANCVELEKMFEVAKKTTDKGDAQINTARTAVLQMGDAVSQVVNELPELNGQVDSISKFSKTIKNIFSQIDLLSVNASVVAARAGEHGRGFSIVAQEVKKLADQSKASVNEIDALIEKVREVTESVIRKVKSTQVETEKGLSASAEVGILMAHIKKTFEQSNAGVIEISAAIQQQGHAAPIIPDLLSNIQAVSHQTQEDLDEAAQELHQLEAVSLEMEKILEKFRKH